ncbi:acyl-CoA thioesterase [Sphingomonas flavalba]|uniref:acyl-CoA thioesterase n=1 Tax=Sphingomonas flavalba TaxID=2559804 RepID=UPI0039E18FE4
MSFVARRAVRFAHVDAAGIVFYPRYFEMLNATVEDFFAGHVGVDFATLHLKRGLAIPTVKLDVDFVAPSRLGETLAFHLTVERVGDSSLHLTVEVRCGDTVRLRAAVVIVSMAMATGRSQPWPDDIRAALLKPVDAA